jgi:hypothetical protein
MQTRINHDMLDISVAGFADFADSTLQADFLHARGIL